MIAISWFEGDCYIAHRSTTNTVSYLVKSACVPVSRFAQCHPQRRWGSVMWKVCINPKYAGDLYIQHKF